MAKVELKKPVVNEIKELLTDAQSATQQTSENNAVKNVD